MHETTIDDIKKIAHRLHDEKKEWHFHILTPDCMLNKSKKHAFILEDISDDETYVHYSAERQLEAGKELVTLLHKIDTTQKGTSDKNILVIKKRAEEFNKKNIPWHHHMLFPQCAFNKHGKWCIIFEDKENGKIIESVTDEEPMENLSIIEKLYYEQKK
jgi:hypothetical protein